MTLKELNINVKGIVGASIGSLNGALFLQDDFKINVRLVDCVGYVIEGASGYQDDSGIRLVKTPW